MSLTAKLNLTLAAVLTSALDLSTPTDSLSYSHLVSLTSGTGDNQADLMWHDQRTLAASASENLDLAGVLTDALGATLTVVELVALGVFAASGNTNDVLVAREATNGVPLFSAASDQIIVKPGGALWWVAPKTGIAVTAGTGDKITVTNSAGTTGVTYDVVVIGRSA